MLATVEWKDGAVRLLDQSRLPERVEFLDCRDYRTVAMAIRELRVRGAPAIGVTAAMGVALGAQSITTKDPDEFKKAVLVHLRSLGGHQTYGGESVLGHRAYEADIRGSPQPVGD